VPFNNSNRADDVEEDDDDSELRLSFTLYEGEREALGDAGSWAFEEDNTEQLAESDSNTETSDTNE